MLHFDEQLERLIDNAWAEDVGEGDHSSMATIPPGASGRAELKIKQHGILAGMAVAEKIFGMKAAPITFVAFKKDGDPMEAGENAFEVQCSVRGILSCERLVLNCMQRMSGIASLTRQYADKLTGYKTKILDTRKSTPGFRLLEKEAVRIGGGVNHRFGLYDMIMLKDNHIDFSGGLEKAVQKANEYRHNKNMVLKIEVETRNIGEVERVLAIGGIDRIMLDNFTPPGVAAAVELIAGRFETEASGGINLDNVVEFAKTGVDYISIGALIHQAKSLDMSLKAIVENPTE
jgi:nicotinate-nucleotide pyrophosphorylase (carboxylating)